MELEEFKGVEVNLTDQERQAIDTTANVLTKIVKEMEHRGLEYWVLFGDIECAEDVEIKQMIKVLESAYYYSILK